MELPVTSLPAFTSDLIFNGFMGYNFNEHLHRYAVWTAARAVQRSFTTTAKVSEAIAASTLRDFREVKIQLTQKEFDVQHKQWAYSIINYFGSEHQCSFGRAAKIIGIYLKTSVVLPNNGQGVFCELIHPPIDSILLTSLSEKEEFRDFKKKRWTSFDESAYLSVADRIRNANLPFNWRLEKFWKPERDVTVGNKLY